MSSFSLSHASFLFLSIALSLCLSLFLPRPLSHIRSAEMHPRAKSHRTTPLSQRKKLESVCPDISPAPARSEGRGKDRGREKGREREGERGERDWGRGKGIDGKTARGSATQTVHVREESSPPRITFAQRVDTATACVHACVYMWVEGVTMRFVIHFVSVYSIIHPGVQRAANMPGTACDRVRQPWSEIFMRHFSVETEM